MMTPGRHLAGRLRRLLIVAFVAAVLASGAIWGFVGGQSTRLMEVERERPVNKPPRVYIDNGEPTIRLDAATQRRGGITTTSLQNAPYRKQLRAYAAVLDLQQLTELSNGYLNAKAQREMAQAKLAASQTAFERAQRLYRDQQNISAAQLQAAEAAFRVDEAGVTAARSQLRTLAATAQQNWGPVLGRALVDETPVLARLIERQDVLLQVTLQPGEIMSQPPATGAAETSAGMLVNIRFLSAATKTDPQIQGISYFYTAPADASLLPGMNVLALLPLDATVDGVVVPASAVIWWQGRAWIYQRTGPETFTRREIATDMPAPNGGYVARDLPNAVEIVTQGAQLLLSEEFRAQVQVIGDEVQ